MLRLLPLVFFFCCFSIFGQTDTVVPFSQIDTPAAYQGCENEALEAISTCTLKAIETFAKSKFNTGLFKNLNLNEKRIRVYAQFVVDPSGNIKNIAVRTAHPQLEKETRRVLSLVPPLKPATHKGNPTAMKYTLPLIFILG